VVYKYIFWNYFKNQYDLRIRARVYK